MTIKILEKFNDIVKDYRKTSTLDINLLSSGKKKRRKSSHVIAPETAKQEDVADAAKPEEEKKDGDAVGAVETVEAVDAADGPKKKLLRVAEFEFLMAYMKLITTATQHRKLKKLHKDCSESYFPRGFTME